MLSREDCRNLVKEWIAAAVPGFSADHSRIKMGDSSAHYPNDIAGMEGFSRLLWGLFPLMSGGGDCQYWPDFLNGIRNGTDPTSDGYWGDLTENDQRCVEMAVYGLGLALPSSPLWSSLTASERANLARWLRQSGDIRIPDNNWHFFPVLVQVGLKCVGEEYDASTIDRHLSAIESWYLGNGWYSDGADKPRDYYISTGFHFYGLLYSKFMQDVDPERCALYRERAKQFARDYIHYFSADGNSIPFGRSLTYRFVHAAFWSAAAYAGLDIFTPDILKGIILRHLSWWLEQPFQSRDGLFSIGYTYPNLIMAEDYNSPGSPYWALKTMLILALNDTDDFWQADCEPLPTLAGIHRIAEARQFIQHDSDNQHASLLMSGQFETNDYVNCEQKYCKFAYSSHFGFTLERGRHGLHHAACDSMLVFNEGDGYYRGRRECDAVEVAQRYLRSEWHPWPDVGVTTWLIPEKHGHIRIHRVETSRALDCSEGGFSVQNPISREANGSRRGLTIHALNGVTQIVNLLDERDAHSVITPPNSNILFSEPAAIPCLSRSLSSGTHWLAAYVYASPNPASCPQSVDRITFDRESGLLHVHGDTIRIQ